MTLRRKQKALLHVAKKDLRLSDDDYRVILVHVAGVTSSTELDRAGFDAVMGAFERLGFKPLARRGPDYGRRPGMASLAQLDLNRDLWTEWSGAAPEDGLETWVKRTFKVDSLRFLTADAARKATTALPAMKARKRAA